MAIRHYRVVLTTVGPVHIGNGSSYSGKDYFKVGDGRVGVLDTPRFVQGLVPGELDDYCRFLETDSRHSLRDFLDGHPGLEAKARSCLAYDLEATLSKARRGTDQYLDVAQFVKDAYGNPYVPGSSVKGMLRTAILAHIIASDRAAFAELYDPAAAKDWRDRKRACKRIERKALWRERVGAGGEVVTNDIMRYVSVSDSAPLSTGDLVFVKKYDKFSRADDGHHKLAMGRISKESGYYEGNELNIYRECLKPGTVVNLRLDVDERIDKYLDALALDLGGISSVLRSSFELYSRCFLDSFDLDDGPAGNGVAPDDDGICRYVIASGPLAGRRCPNRAVGSTGYCNTHKDQAALASASVGFPSGEKLICYLGGGVDFDSKTVVNALLDGDESRVREISGILYEQFPTKLDTSLHGDLEKEVRESGFSPRKMRAEWRGGRLKKGKDDHRHWRDAELGVSPHTAKLGIIGTKKHPMGKCTIDIQEARG